MSSDILITSWDQCRSMVQYSITSTETRRLVRTDSRGRPPRLSHSYWTMERGWSQSVYDWLPPVHGMVPSATRVNIRLVVCLSGTAVTIISLPVLVKNELGNLHSSLLLYCILYYTGSSSVNWLAVSCILTATLWDTGFKCKSSTRFMCLIINHFVTYYSNLQVNYRLL